MFKNNYEAFMADLESLNIQHTAAELTVTDQRTIDTVYGTVKEFIVENNLVPAEQIASLESFDSAIKTLNSSTKLTDIGTDAVIALCKNCGIPDNHLKAATESLALCIHNYSSNYTAQSHFSAGSPSASHGEFEMRGLDSMYSKGALDRSITTAAMALESFGADISNTISDAKVAITVSILRYHRSLLHRLIPNIPTDSNMVRYKVDHMEVYDLTKSRSNEAAIRYEDRHRIPFVDLYNDPSPANTKLKPIILRVANDEAAPDNKLVAENIVKIGESVNMFDLSVDSGVIGYSHADFTDLVADNVRVKTLYFEVTDGTVKETVPVEVANVGGSRMLMNANNQDSADRICAWTSAYGFDNTTKLITGSTSTLLAGLSSDGVVRLKYNASGSINLKSSETVVLGSVDTQLQTKTGNAPIAADQTLFGSLKITMVAYEVAAEFSEENIRKTTKAMRIMTKEVGYEIPGSSNTVVQYSLTQTRPEVVIDGLTKLMSLGNDDRGIKLIMDAMGDVRNRIMAEAALTGDNYVHKVGQDFVSGQRVKPAIFMDTMIIDPNLKYMRSGEKWGDIRGFAEEYLLNVLARLFRESFYTQEIGQGEKPVFSVLTSIPIKESILSVPHYHSHLGDQAKDAVSDGAVEFRRTMPDGTVLNVITTTFNYMDDKLLMVPVRPSRPDSTLNFAHNRERGQYLCQATPTIDNAIFNSLIGNSREFPIVTAPIGALITIAQLHEIFDNFGQLGTI